MAKNLMPKILKKLGVEYGEKFQIYAYGTELYKDSLFFFDKDYGLTMVKSNGSRSNADIMVYGILCGHYTIVKLKWEPKKHDFFYYPFVAEERVASSFWEDYNTFHLALKALGMLYRTEAEAEEHLAEDYMRLTGEPWSSR